MTNRRDLRAAIARSRLHWSWVPALVALAWVLASDHFPRVGGSAWATALVVGLTVVCVVIQEAARRVAMWSAGDEVAPVVLWPAGGIPANATTPPIRAEIRGALVAPLASFGLAALFATVAGGGTFGAAADVLARSNAAFAIFGLIPALPLAGGALLRSALRARGRSFAEASATASRASLAFGLLLLATGLARIATGDPRGGVGLGVAAVVLGGAARAGIPNTSTVGRITLRGTIAAAPIVLVMLIAVSSLYHPPLALAAPGEPFDVLGDVMITGVDVSPVRGRYFAASVRVQDPSALHAFVSLFRRDHYLLRRETLRPIVEDPFRPAGDAAGLFSQSREYAAIAAAQAVGIPVKTDGSGVRILAAGPRARAAGFLPGDTIVGAEGRPIARLEELRAAVVARPAGTSFTLVVERGDQRVQRSIRSTVSERSGGVPYLDMQGATRDFRYTLPFQIRFRAQGELGASSGFAYALAIADLLDPRDLARGRTIAATGRIELDGQVKPIIGAIAKQWSALETGASLFVISQADALALERAVLPVLGVQSLEDAIEKLER